MKNLLFAVISEELSVRGLLVDRHERT